MELYILTTTSEQWNWREERKPLGLLIRSKEFRTICELRKLWRENVIRDSIERTCLAEERTASYSSRWRPPIRQHESGRDPGQLAHFQAIRYEMSRDYTKLLAHYQPGAVAPLGNVDTAAAMLTFEDRWFGEASAVHSWKAKHTN